MRIIDMLDPDRDDLLDTLGYYAADTDRLSAARARMLVDLVERLLGQGPSEQAYGELCGGELWLQPCRPAGTTSVKVWPDWRDCGPVRDGLPVMYYRLEVRRPGSGLSDDDRIPTAAAAAQAIRRAFGWDEPPAR